jgi:hypothetical protein
VKAVRFVLLGDEKGATKALSGVSKGMVAVGATLAAGAAAAIKFGSDSVKVFTTAASEAAKLSRITGLTTENASRLGFAMKQSGVEVAAGTKAFTILGKTLNNASGSATATASITEKLGFAFTDASGRVKDMSELLPEIADRFAGMENGGEKTALAMKLFGKSGADLIPMLNKGADGLAELARKSDEFGNTIGDKQLQALKDSKQAQRDWDAAMQGLQITLGSQLLPLLTEGAQLINTSVIPAIKGATDWFRQNDGVLKPLILTLGGTALALGAVVGAAKALEVLKATRATILGVAAAMEAMSTKAKIATASAGAIGIALAVAGAVYAAFAGEQQKAQDAVEDYTEALKADNGALAENTRLTIAKRLEDSGLLAAGQKLGIGLDVLTAAVMGQGAAYDSAMTSVKGYLSGWRDNSSITADQVKAAQDLYGALGIERQHLDDSKAAYDRVTTAAGATTTATEAATGATKDSTSATEKWTAAYQKAAQARLALSGSLMGLESAYDEATKAAKENGKGIDISTEKGRANRTALNQIAAAGLTAAAAVKEQTGSQEKANRVTNDARGKFLDAAKAMGIGRDRAKEMANNLGLIKSKTVTVKTRFEKTGPTSWKVNVSGGRVSMIPVANGGIIHAFAGGGIENHAPNIYRRHDGPRLFNEPETGGEAYVPLANDWRRPRAVAVWRQAGRELGQYAGGGIRGAGGGSGMNVYIQITADALTDTTALARRFRGVLLDLKNGPFNGRELGIA